MYRLILIIYYCATISDSIALNLFNISNKHNLINETILVAGAHDKSYLLPTHLKPLSYDINIFTNIHKNNFTFIGNEIITFKVIEPNTFNITLHMDSKNIIQTIKLNGFHIHYDNIKRDVDRDFLVIKTDNELLLNEEYRLRISYIGVLREDNKGFYKSSYINDDNKEIFLATTQFQPTYARHAFPCWDEPAFKAKFQITIIHGTLYNAISNMPFISVTNLSNDATKTIFYITPLMSTYLVIFVISDFQMKSNDKTKLSNELLHQVYVQPNKINQTDFALEAGEKILKGLENYLNVTFELPRIGQVSIPNFAEGAMENWGLSSYRSSIFLIEPNVSSSNQMETLVSVISHEFAHQFFGNVVTPKWWTFLWLSEGLATLFESILSNLVYPKYQAMDTFVVHRLQKSLEMDSLKSSRIMSQPAYAPTEIRFLFDNIAYTACVLRMFMHSMTEDTFKKGLKYYLATNKENVVEPYDLAIAFNKSISEDKTIPSHILFTEVINSWSTQHGYPVLNIVRNYTDNRITLSQERFLISGKETTIKTWWLPYTFIVENDELTSNTTPDGWIHNEKSIEILPSSVKNWTNNQWVLFNKDQTGYYRVNYDEHNWMLLIEQLNNDHKKIQYLNRVQLINDVMSLARSDRLTYDIPIQLFGYLKKETEYFPWVAAEKQLEYFTEIFIGTKSYPFLLKYIQELTTQPFKKLFIANDTSVTKSFHNNEFKKIVKELACSSGQKDCLIESHKELKEIITNNSTINFSNDLCYGMKKANKKEFLYFFYKLHNTKFYSERSILIKSLSCSEDTRNLMFFLKSSKEKFGTKVKEIKISYRISDRVSIIEAVTNNNIGLDVVIKFLEEDFIEIKKITKNILSIFTNIIRRIKRKSLLHKITNMLNKRGISEQGFHVPLELANKRIQWTEEREKSVLHFFQDYYHVKDKDELLTQF